MWLFWIVKFFEACEIGDKYVLCVDEILGLTQAI
jgi:hypothetical protein